MDISPTELKTRLRSGLMALGAAAVGFATAQPVEQDEWAHFAAWLEAGMNGGLEYLTRYGDVRRDPRRLLIDKDGQPIGRTVVSIAWPYLPAVRRAPALPYIALYAYGEDYHRVTRRLLRPVVRQLKEKYDIRARAVTDTAPILERYWAVRAGVGFVGRNRCLIVPGVGSWVFLSELILDITLPPDEPSARRCAGCTACLRACPMHALTPDGVDCCRCLSALTIETPDRLHTVLLDELRGRHLLGCDACQLHCPHNACAPTSHLFPTLPQTLTLDAPTLSTLTPETFAATFAATPLSRPGLSALRSNLDNPNNSSGY